MIELVNNQTGKLLMKVVELIKENPDYTNAEISSKLSSTERRIAFTVEFGVRRGLISIEAKRNYHGHFDGYSRRVIDDCSLLEKVIKKLLVCVECGEKFKAKKAKSKYKNICIPCTEDKFMTRKEVTCVWCNLPVQKRLAARFEGKTLYLHDDCVEAFRENRRDAKENKRLSEKKIKLCTHCSCVMQEGKKMICDSCQLGMKIECEWCLAKVQHITNHYNESITCKKKNFVKEDYYGHHSTKLNMAAPMRAPFILGKACYVCGYDNCIDYHHVIERNEGGENKISNLIPLCPNHHREVHRCGLDLTPYIQKRDKILLDIMNA